MTPDEPPSHHTPERPVFGPSGRDLQFGRRYTRWAVWGCGGIMLAGLLLFMGFLLVTLQRPEGKQFLKASEQVAVCREHLIHISGALDRYRSDKGVAPARLEDLYPTYLAEKSDLRCPADTGTEVSSYVYRPGVAWGTPDTDFVVFCPHHPLPMKFAGVSQKDTPYILLYIRPDGNVGRSSVTLSQIKKLESGDPVKR